MTDIPHALATIVEDRFGRTVIVSQVSYENCGSQPATYAVRGHPDLGSEPASGAWHDHEDLTPVETPSARTWALLKDAVHLDAESRVLYRPAA